MPSSPATTVPQWRRNPATVNPPAGVEDFIARSNQYFEECADTDTRPTLTGYALAVGLPGPTSLLRLGQRIPQLRYVISRCMIAVSVGYEELIGFGNAAGPMFMLKNIPDFDPDEPLGAPPVQFFNDRKEILLQSNVHGAARADKEFEGEDPIETYIRLLQKRGYVPGDEQPSTTVFKTPTPAQPRRALTIITEGWEDE
jgi:hypothetical protein